MLEIGVSGLMQINDGSSNINESLPTYHYIYIYNSIHSPLPTPHSLVWPCDSSEKQLHLSDGVQCANDRSGGWSLICLWEERRRHFSGEIEEGILSVGLPCLYIYLYSICTGSIWLLTWTILYYIWKLLSHLFNSTPRLALFHSF